MAIDKEKYIRKFIDEGLEHIALVESLIIELNNGISASDNLAALLRALHTLKGSSRMLEFKKIEELSHCLESAFISYKEQKISLSENAVKLMLSSLDLLKTGLAEIEKTKNDNIDITDCTKNLLSLAANESFSVPAAAKETKKQEESEHAAKPEENRNVKKDSGANNKTESIRIDLSKIDEIIKSIASLQSIEIFAKNISQECFQLNAKIKEYVKLFKEKNESDFSLLSELRKLERFSDKIHSSLKNYAVDAGNNIRIAYDSVISLRTMPLSTLLDNYPRFVYELSVDTGKKVQLIIEGKENEIDKNIIESLGEVFMHIVRNAVDHGLETPKERIEAGKNETGILSIVCSRESGSMKIVITDDGRGIDHEKIRLKAVKEGFVTQDKASSLTKEDLTNFIFHSGFSTSGKVSNISGRGVGMDVVREIVESLKGSIFVESSPGKGTAFIIMVPLSIAAIMGFPVASSSMKFIIPATFVDTILLINRDDIITVIDRPEIKYNDRMIKLYFLNHVLRINTKNYEADDNLFVLIIRSYDDIAAIAVDNVDSMRSVILKSMPKFMENNPVFSGMVLNEDYEMISVLHIPAVLKMAKRHKITEVKNRDFQNKRTLKSILVVDDSKPTRDIESDILTSEGYLVDTAQDGSIALEALKSKQYDLILTDLNMPVMDGFQLIENVRLTDEFKNIPIIVISSIDNEEDKQKTYHLGASRYIVKSSFNNSNLLEAIRELIGENND